MVTALAGCLLESAHVNAAISPVRLIAPPLAPLSVSSCASVSFPPCCPLLVRPFREGAGLFQGQSARWIPAVPLLVRPAPPRSAPASSASFPPRCPLLARPFREGAGFLQG